MAMNSGRWVLDVGNTRVKFARHAADGTWTVYSDGAARDAAMHSDFQPEAVLVAASGAISAEWQTLCAGWGDRCVKPSAADAAFLPRTYAPAESLGLDRIANALAVGDAGAWAVVDAGTCITCDLIVDGHFHGGSIAPGLQMRLDVLHFGTARLPHIALAQVEDCALGTTTFGSMGSGAVHGARLEVLGRIGEWHADYPALQVAVTGGDASRLALTTPLPIFADPNLTLRGYHLLLNRMRP